MNDVELLSIWKAYDKRLDESLRINLKNAEDITKIKIRSTLASMKPMKIFTILVGITWVGFIDFLIYHLFSVASPFFLISAGIQVLLTKLAIGIYLYQLTLIHKVNISEPIVSTQAQLARLKPSTIWVARLLFLQFPVWTTFFWNQKMLENGNLFVYVVLIGVTLSFTFLAIWPFVNIRYENKDKRWFRLIFTGNEWTPVIKSMELLREVNAYQSDHHISNKNHGSIK